MKTGYHIINKPSQPILLKRKRERPVKKAMVRKYHLFGK
ncbi:hypothetical protein SAMN05443574_1408 [Haloarcula vallismortis]|uniref:Uncharacterized protein n=1 Tax=Haloarcula vallismortis TaxID=28442 RepID=A0A1H3B9V9_HALVA|nr:hypothetical protein SAMN05443574_1408 [Haloarcula vallismortis]